MSEQGKQPKLRVCLPAYDDIDPMTVHSLFELRNAVPFTLDMIGVAEVAVSRTLLIDRIEEDDTHVLWLDADMVFTPQHFFMLFEALEANPQMGLISGLAVRRDGSQMPCVNWRMGKSWCSKEEMLDKVQKYTDMEVIREVDVTGLAFTLMRTEVFDKIKKPYFHPRWIDNPDDMEDYLFYGEDSDFVKKLKARGYHPSVHFGVHLGHVGKKVWVPVPPARIIEEMERQKNAANQPDSSDSDEDEIRDGSEVSSG